MNCSLVQDLAKTYFENFFVNHPNISWSKDMMLLGANDNLSKEKAFLINLEIMTFNLYIFNLRKLKKLPAREDLEYHMKYYRELFLFSKKYKNIFLSWSDNRPG